MQSSRQLLDVSGGGSTSALFQSAPRWVSAAANDLNTRSLSPGRNLAHMSVSGASQRVACLEAAFGQKLFHRYQRGLMATPPGLVVVGAAASILAQLNSLESSLDGGAAGPDADPSCAGSAT